MAKPIQGSRKSLLSRLREEIRGRPRDPHPRAALGMALDDAGRHEEALECYRKAVSLRPGYETFRLLLEDATEGYGARVRARVRRRTFL